MKTTYTVMCRLFSNNKILSESPFSTFDEASKFMLQTLNSDKTELYTYSLVTYKK